MLNRSASLAMLTSVLKALPGKLDIKRYSLSILYVYELCHIFISACTDTDVWFWVGNCIYFHSFLFTDYLKKHNLIFV